MKRLFSLVLLLVLTTLGFAQIKSTPISSATDPAGGLIYSLPKTVFVVEVETRMIQETPGIYFPYAERYLGTTNVCQQEAIHYEIVGVKLTTKAIPDLQNAYVISTGKSKTPESIQLTPEGFLKSIGKSDCGSKMDMRRPEEPNKPNCVDNYQSQEKSIVTLEMQQATSTAKMAELAAAQLFNLRDTRINLLTLDLDKTPADGRSYEIILGELNRMEKYYTELFSGKRTEKIEKSTFEYDPQKNGEEILFRFSQLKGVVEKTNLGGDPVFINLKKEVGTMADIVKTPAEDSKKVYSVYYRVPGKAQVKVTNGTTVFCDQSIPVAQFGRIMNLPEGALKSAEFCPMTGAIMNLEK